MHCGQLHLTILVTMTTRVNIFPPFLLSSQRKSVDDPDTLSRYSSQYEAQLDPFSAFGARVSEPRRNLAMQTYSLVGRFACAVQVPYLVGLSQQSLYSCPECMGL